MSGFGGIGIEFDGGANRDSGATVSWFVSFRRSGGGEIDLDGGRFANLGDMYGT